MGDEKHTVELFPLIGYIEKPGGRK